MYFGNCSQNDGFIFNGIKLTNSYEEKTLGLVSDKELKFEAQKRISSLSDFEKKMLISKAVIKSPFSYCLLI